MEISSATKATINILLIPTFKSKKNPKKPHNIVSTFRYFVHNLDVQMTQFSLSEKSHQNAPFVYNSTNVFPLCWLVSRCSRATPSQLPLRRALVCEGACRRLGRSSMLPQRKPSASIRGAALYMYMCIYVAAPSTPVTFIYVWGLQKQRRARSSRMTGVRLNVREQKETAGEMAGEGVEGVCACFARDCACCWFC